MSRPAHALRAGQERGAASGADACIECARASSRSAPRRSIGIRGLLAEFGVVLPQRAVEVRRRAADCSNSCRHAQPALSAIYSRMCVCSMNASKEYERELERSRRATMSAKRASAERCRPDHRLGDRRQCRRCARIQERPAVRRLARARTAAVLHRRQDPARTHHRRGDPYLRTLLIMGARSCCSAREADRSAVAVGRSPCECGADTTALASPSPPKTRGSSGRCSISTLRLIAQRLPITTSSSDCVPTATGQTDVRRT